MSSDLSIACTCRQVLGVAHGVEKGAVNFITCYCADCQAFARFLGNAGMINSRGGTPIVQLPLNQVDFEAGVEKLALMRLSEKGLARWYASCCRAPMGNTVGPVLPFVGCPISMFVGVDAATLLARLGPPASFYGRDAIGGRQNDLPATAKPWPLLRSTWRLVRWKMQNKGKANAYFDEQGQPRKVATVLTSEQRHALATGADM
jgi:hypothetical protein